MRSRLAVLLLVVMLGATAVMAVPSESQSVSSPASAASLVYASDLAGDVYNDVFLSGYKSLVQEFAGFGPKPYGSAANDQVRQWIIDELDEVSEGRIVARTLGHYASVIGCLPGTVEGNKSVIMVGAHYDSVEVSPGANDDGSGVAASLELARMLSQYSWPLDVMFCFWNAEELGLLGSAEVAEMFAENETDILVYYNFDMLLVPDSTRPENQSVLLAYTSTRGSIYQDAQYWADVAQAMNINFGTPVIQPIRQNLQQYWAYSDHYPFYAEDYKTAIFVGESALEEDVAYHTSADTYDNPLYHYSVAVETTASIGAAIAFTLGRTQGQRVYERYSISLAPEQTRKLVSSMTLADEISITCSWLNGTGLGFVLRDPASSIIASYASTMETGTDIEVVNTKLQQMGLHTLVIGNEGADAATVSIELEYESDYEGNSIPDSLETWQHDFSVDSDNDSISNGDEEFLGTDRYSADADEDGLTDFEEVFIYHTYPNYNDSDRDGCPDKWETDNGLSPLLNDASGDPDSDMLPNLDEFLAGTLPQDNDTDDDGCPDGWEVLNELDPLVDDSDLDLDGDFASNLSEYRIGTDPHSNDLVTPLVIAASLSLPIIAIVFVVRKARAR